MNRGSEAAVTGQQAPVKPNQEECCKRGCEPCIFDYYEIAVKRWQAENQSPSPV